MLRVHFCSGAKAGAPPIEFDDQKVVIRFGRDPAHCDVVFPESDTRVGREHFEVRRQSGQYRLLTDRRHVVLVNGTPGHDDQILDDGCELQVAVGGPIVRLERERVEVGSETVGAVAAVPGTATNLGRIERQVVRTRRAGLGTIGAVVLLAIVGVAAFFLGKRTVEMQAEQVASAVQRVDALAGSFEKQLAEAKASFGPIVERVEPSIYRVEAHLRAGPLQGFHLLGTAWVAAPGVLATNAHVVEAREQLRLGPDERLVVRDRMGAVLEIDDASIAIHPGYDLFDEMVRTSRSFDPNVGGGLSLIPACDVALVEVREVDRSKLAPPLPLASQEELERLAAGTPVAYVGYPMEGIVHGGADVESPIPTSLTGTLISATDFFLGREGVAPDQRQLLRFSMTVAGGASGSPILNQAGQVIGLVNAGNFVGLQERIPVGGMSYGQRADLLMELLTKDADARLVARRDAWTSQFDRLFRFGADGLFVLLPRAFRSRMENRILATERRRVELTGGESHSTRGTLTGRGLANGVRIPIELDGPGWYQILGSADRPLDLDALLLGADEPIHDSSEHYWVQFELAVAGPIRLEAVVYTEEARVAPSTDVELRVFRFQE